MFSFESCENVPVRRGGQGGWGGGLVEVEGRVVWRGVFEEANTKWRRVVDGEWW